MKGSYERLKNVLKMIESKRIFSSQSFLISIVDAFLQNDKLPCNPLGFFSSVHTRKCEMQPSV